MGNLSAQSDTQTGDLFRPRLLEMLDQRHPLVVLTSRLDWARLTNEVSSVIKAQRATEHSTMSATEASAARPPNLSPPANDALAQALHLDWFDADQAPAQRAREQPKPRPVSAAGRPRLPLRLMCALLYLKHSFDLSDEQLCERWAENVVWQYFSGQLYYEPKQPCDATQIGRFRVALGAQGVERLLKATVDAALANHMITPDTLTRVIVDTTVQEKAIAYPTDSRLMEIARYLVVKHAKAVGISFKQTYAKEGAALRRKAGGYAHAKQFKRLRGAVKRQRTILGKLIREAQQKCVAKQAQLQVLQSQISASALTAVSTADSKQSASLQRHHEVLKKGLATLTQTLERATRLMQQKSKDSDKLYAMHAPEVECISKGKARNRYEFGVKVSVAITHEENLIVGTQRMSGRPYDGHTLNEQLQQVNAIISDSGECVAKAYVDLGYKGAQKDNPRVMVIDRSKIKKMDKDERAALKRRQAVEPVIGHLKSDHRMRRCHLKGSLGDQLHAMCCAAGYNIQWLLRVILKLGLGLLALGIITSAVIQRATVKLAQLVYRAAISLVKNLVSTPLARRWNLALIS
jgi:transposase, IS5 family